MIKAVIVEDEKNSQELLKELITEYCEGVEVVDIAGNVAEALEAIETQKPDLIFLDIELPDGDGFQVAHLDSAHHRGRQHLGGDLRPAFGADVDDVSGEKPAALVPGERDREDLWPCHAEEGLHVDLTPLDGGFL